MRNKVLFILVHFLFSFQIQAQPTISKVIDLEEYGIRANAFQNASPALAKAIQDAAKYENAVIRFPGGRIDLWPEGAEQREYYISNATESDSIPKIKTIGMLFENISNLTLEGNGTLIVCHGKMVHMVIDHCRNFTVNGLSFDYERPTMSEMEMLEKGKDFVTVRIHPDSRFAIEQGKLIWYGEGWKSRHHHMLRFVPSEETMYYDSWKPFANSQAEKTGPLTVRFKGDFSQTNFQKGDLLTIRDPYREAVGVLNTFSHQVTFEDVRLHYMHGLGIVSQFSKDITLKGVKVMPRKGSGRVIAAFADCFHFSGCYGKIQIEDCLASGSHDDPVNVHGTHLRVVASEGTRLKVRFMHHQTWGIQAFEAGDTIAYVDNANLLVYDRAIVKKARMLSRKEMELELDRPVPKALKEKHCIENISKSPEVLIRNNRFEHTNTRGLLITTRRKVLVENNIFFRTGMHAILIANDCNFWFESGPVRDVTIRNNKFIECGYNSSPDNYVIAIKPETHRFVKGKYVHENIRIIDNEFTVFDTPLLFARSTTGLVFKGNEIQVRLSETFPRKNKPMFSLTHCDEVHITDNHFGGETISKELSLHSMKKKQIQYAPKKEYTLLYGE
ncbi:right-handed parallel beta-helix repeat-containing protein [Rapidithrix thailandica]|uniref:Right-handed parallel beta-helix repeat-containing protein n=1 Tax=Rapidithrix thailandica TaxID=413964 RepID=A0AAW9SAP9_9BACT